MLNYNVVGLFNKLSSDAKQVALRKPYKTRRESPYGFRITKEGMYEVTDLSIVTHGLGQQIKSQKLVQVGYRFSYDEFSRTVETMGEWYAVLPLFKREDYVYFVLIGEYDKLLADKHNRESKTVLRELCWK